MADELQAPWTPDQIAAINTYQTNADLPLICSLDHDGWHMVLIAHRDGMHCSVPECGYRQVWGLKEAR
jgi:hypothetical protein